MYEITWVGNEGVVVTTGAGAFAVDAFFGDGADGFGAPSADLRARLEGAEAPFERIDVILATHFHPDHFDSRAVSRALDTRPGAIVVTTSQAAARLGAAGADPSRVRALRCVDGEPDSVRAGALTITGFGLSHGRVNYGDVENLALVIDDGSAKTLHLGDGIIHEGTLRRAGVLDMKIDVAVLPFWYLTYPFGRRLMRERFRPRAIVAVHAPDAEREAIAAEARATRADAVVPREPGRRWRLEGGRLVPAGRADA